MLVLSFSIHRGRRNQAKEIPAWERGFGGLLAEGYVAFAYEVGHPALDRFLLTLELAAARRARRICCTGFNEIPNGLAVELADGIKVLRSCCSSAEIRLDALDQLDLLCSHDSRTFVSG